MLFHELIWWITFQYFTHKDIITDGSVVQAAVLELEAMWIMALLMSKKIRQVTSWTGRNGTLWTITVRVDMYDLSWCTIMYINSRMECGLWDDDVWRMDVKLPLSDTHVYTDLHVTALVMSWYWHSSINFCSNSFRITNKTLRSSAPMCCLVFSLLISPSLVRPRLLVAQPWR